MEIHDISISNRFSIKLIAFIDSNIYNDIPILKQSDRLLIHVIFFNLARIEFQNSSLVIYYGSLTIDKEVSDYLVLIVRANSFIKYDIFLIWIFFISNIYRYIKDSIRDVYQNLFLYL